MNNPNVQYGATERTEILDDNGSTRTVVKNVRNGETQRPVRIRYAIRHRTDKTNVTKIQEIAQNLVNDFTKLDAELKLEKTNTGEQQGYFNLVECYTVLEY